MFLQSNEHLVVRLKPHVGEGSTAVVVRDSPGTVTKMRFLDVPHETSPSQCPSLIVDP